MGMVNVEIAGSFGPRKSTQFSAMEGGHALALTRAISFLVEQLPAAIQLDHTLAAVDDKPPKSDFGKLPAVRS